MTTYNLVAEERAIEIVMTATKAEKSQMANVFRQLMTNPYQRGNSQYTRHGRTFEVKRFDKWLVTFWADHAVKEVRIVDILKLKPLP